MEELLIIKDNFYKDPDKVVAIAKGLKYVKYEETWYSSAYTTKYGKKVNNPFNGYRYNEEEVITNIEQLIKKRINRDTWYTGGDNWNGAFHMKYKNENHTDFIHHHYKPNDCENGYSGVVYLNKGFHDSGTKIWKNKKTQKITGEFGPFFEKYNNNDWELYKHIIPKFNRIVLFKGDVYHSGDVGFGENESDCRLFQTFFFNVDENS